MVGRREQRTRTRRPDQPAGRSSARAQRPDVATFDDHMALLRQARFDEVGPVWQHGNDRGLVAGR
jgi:hypothetical protein